MAFEDIQRVDRLGEKDKSALIAARAYIYFKRKNRLAGDVAFVIQRWLTGHFFQTANSLGRRKVSTGLVT